MIAAGGSGCKIHRCTIDGYTCVAKVRREIKSEKKANQRKRKEEIKRKRKEEKEIRKRNKKKK